MAQDEISLPDLKVPAPRRPVKLDTSAFTDTGTALQGKTAGGWLDQIASDLERSDPENAPILKGMLEARVRQITGDSTFQFQDKQDRALANMKYERERLLLQREIAAGQLDEAYAAMVDDPRIAKRFGPVDELRKNPEAFAAVANELGFKITPGHFAVAGDKYAGISAQQAQTAADEEARATQVKEVGQERGLLEDLKALTAGTSKTPPLLETFNAAGRAKAGIEARGEQMGQDLMPNWFERIWTDDNANSWQGLNREFESLVGQAGPILGKRQAQGFLEVIKDKLGGALKGMTPETRKTEGGGEQTYLVPNDEKQLLVARLAARISKIGNMPIEDILKFAGSDANAIDTSGLKQ